MELTSAQLADVGRARGNLAAFAALPPRKRGDQVPEYCGIFRANVEMLLDVIAQLTAPPATGWPEDGEAQRIAEVFADARAEQDRGL